MNGPANVPTYELEHPESNETRRFDWRAYLWASLFGPFYVLTHGFLFLAALMLPISMAIFAVAFGTVTFVDLFFDSDELTISALVAAPIAALTAQGVAAIELSRWNYLRRGWRGGYY